MHEVYYALGWATMIYIYIYIYKIRQRRAQQKETKDLQILQGRHKGAIRINVDKWSRAQHKKLKWIKVQARLSRFLLNITLKHSLSLFDPLFHSPLTPWPCYIPNKAHVNQGMTNFAFEFGFWNGTRTRLWLLKKWRRSLEVCTCTFRLGTHGRCPKTIVIVGYI